MATTAEIAALMAKPCPWCGVRPGVRCQAGTARVTGGDSGGGQRIREVPMPVTTLDGGFHDARWREALGRPAGVVSAALPAAEDPEGESPRKILETAGERPW